MLAIYNQKPIKYKIQNHINNQKVFDANKKKSQLRRKKKELVNKWKKNQGENNKRK